MRSLTTSGRYKPGMEELMFKMIGTQVSVQTSHSSFETRSSVAVAAVASEGVAEDPAHYLVPHPTDCDKLISCQVIIIICH